MIDLICDYIICKLLDCEVTAQGSLRVYKDLRNELAAVLGELRRIENGHEVDSDLLTVISQIANILNEMEGEI